MKNAAAAVKERGEFEAAEAAHYQDLTAQMWSNLPANYQWLHDWRWV